MEQQVSIHILPKHRSRFSSFFFCRFFLVRRPVISALQSNGFFFFFKKGGEYRIFFLLRLFRIVSCFIVRMKFHCYDYDTFAMTFQIRITEKNECLTKVKRGERKKTCETSKRRE